MKTVLKSLKTTFAVSLLWSILAVLGVPMIIFGAIYKDQLPFLGIPLLVAGCIFSGGGFYGLPLLWISYGQKRKLVRVVNAVENLGFTSATALASYMAMDVKTLKADLDTCFKKGYLVNYYRNGDSITPIQRIDPQTVTRKVECDRCGATFTYQGDKGKCPYCQSEYQASENK